MAIGKNQPQYNVLHARPVKGAEGKVIMCFQLTEEEAREISETRKVFYSQLTFGQKFQPMNLFPESHYNEVLVPIIEQAAKDPEPSPVALELAAKMWAAHNTSSTEQMTMQTAQKFALIIDEMIHGGIIKLA